MGRGFRVRSFTSELNKSFHDRTSLSSTTRPRRIGDQTKVVQIIKFTCTVFIDNFRDISTNSSIQVSVCGGGYDGYVKRERNDSLCDPWDSQGDEKCNFYFYCFLPWLFDQKWKYNFRGMQNKSWVAKKLCHGQTLITECSISDYLSNFEGL